MSEFKKDKEAIHARKAQCRVLEPRRGEQIVCVGKVTQPGVEEPE